MKKYPEDFKQRVVEMAKQESIRKAHEFYKIPENTIGRWIKLTNEAEKAAISESHVQDIIDDSLPDARGTDIVNEDNSDIGAAEAHILPVKDDGLHDDAIEDSAEAGTQIEDVRPLNSEETAIDKVKAKQQIRETLRESYDVRDYLQMVNEKLENENRRLKMALMALIQDHSFNQ